MKKFIFLIILALSLFSANGETQAGSNSSSSFSNADAGNTITYRNQSFFNKNNILSIKKEIGDSALLKNINEVRLEGVTATFSANRLYINNIRIKSDTTDLDDYISINFLMDLKSFQIKPQDIKIIKNLGLYYIREGLFSKNITKDIYMTTPTEIRFLPDKLYKVTTTTTKEDEFEMFLDSGTVLTMKTKESTDEFELQIDKPDGSQYERILMAKNSTRTISNRAILVSGIYTFRFVPQNNSDVTLNFGFTNNNRKALEKISSGSRISTSLNGWGCEYAKYHIYLNAGDLLQINSPTRDVWYYLIDSNNQLIKVADMIYHRVSSAGEYYLFVKKKNYTQGRLHCSASVIVTPDSNIASYPILSDIDNQIVKQDENFSLQLSASNNPAKFFAYGLPKGITIDENSGLISGRTTTATGVFPIKVYVENEFGSDQQNFTLTVLSSVEFTGELPEDIQSYLVLTENSVPFYLSPGSYVQAFGVNGVNTINVEEHARLDCQNFIGENEINIEEASSKFTVYRSGATVYLNSTSGTRVKIAATKTPQIFRFADGSLELAIINGNVVIGSQIIDKTEQSINSPVNKTDTSENIF